MSSPNSAGNQMSVAQANGLARAAIIANSLKMTQQIYQGTIAAPGNTNNVININPKNVGLILGFLVRVNGTLTNSDGSHAAAITPFGPANVLSQVIYNDLSNNTRIQTSGWHLNMIDSAKRRRVYGSAVTTDSPVGYGSGWSVITAPATIAASGTGTFQMYYWVPLAYAENDLRGAVYANVIQATQALQLTLNPAPSVQSTGDKTGAMYQMASGGTGGVTLSNVTVTVFQRYLDQLPVANGQVILPPLDISYAYELKNTVGLPSVVVSQDNPILYSNFRQFLSTVMVYDNGGVLNFGSDINYLALQSANFTNIWKLTPAELALSARGIIGDDFPAGTYYMDTRDQPINTIQYGNMALVINPSVVNANASVLMGYEDFALLNTVQGAQSLA